VARELEAVPRRRGLRGHDGASPWWDLDVLSFISVDRWGGLAEWDAARPGAASFDSEPMREGPWSTTMCMRTAKLLHSLQFGSRPSDIIILFFRVVRCPRQDDEWIIVLCCSDHRILYRLLLFGCATTTVIDCSVPERGSLAGSPPQRRARSTAKKERQAWVCSPPPSSPPEEDRNTSAIRVPGRRSQSHGGYWCSSKTFPSSWKGQVKCASERCR
jgi:hypothetical protein